MKVLYISSTKIDIQEKGIYTDLLKMLRDKGHDVSVLYAREKREGLPTMLFQEEGISFLGVKTGNVTKNKNFIEKGISTVMLDTHFKHAYSKFWSKKEFDLILFSTPPITMISTLKFIRKLNTKSVFYLMLKDIFPQNAIDIGILSNPLLVKYFEHKERELYDFFDYIGVMSEANRRFIINKHPNVRHKVEIFPNTLTAQDDVPKAELKRVDFGIKEGDICLFYGGNLGKPQGIDFLIKTMDSVKNKENIKFIIAGKGSEDYKISSYIDNVKPNNIQYLGALPNKEFHDLVSIIDIGLIYLDYRFTIPNYPQRILAFLENSKPVVCATDANTDIGLDAEENGYGYSVLSNDVNTWSEKIEKLANDKNLRVRMGNNGNRYFEEFFTTERSYNILMSHFKEMK